MSALAPTLEAFFTERLLTQRQASPRTVTAYRDTFRLLLNFVHEQLGKPPAHLDIADLDAALIGAFLSWLERDRRNSVRTRNARLAAIHSLFRYAALRNPEHAYVIQRVLAIPSKRYERTVVNFLNQDEIDALLAAVDRTKWTGRRDYALLILAIQTGLRVSELIELVVRDFELGVAAHVRCHGKGRKQQATPLTTQTVTVLRVWLRERGGCPTNPAFPTLRGGPLSADAVQWLLAKYVSLAAAPHCPSLRHKKVSPHMLRHSCAMNLLQSGVDPTVIALRLGHESVQTTQIYLHADLALKERALSRAAPPNTKPGRYRPPDKLLAFLEAL
jgi:site-specific recombinase XerD